MKKICLLLCLAVLAVLCCACAGEKKDTVEWNGKAYEKTLLAYQYDIDREILGRRICAEGNVSMLLGLGSQASEHSHLPDYRMGVLTQSSVDVVNFIYPDAYDPAVGDRIRIFGVATDAGVDEEHGLSLADYVVVEHMETLEGQNP